MNALDFGSRRHLERVSMQARTKLEALAHGETSLALSAWRQVWVARVAEVIELPPEQIEPAPMKIPDPLLALARLHIAMLPEPLFRAPESLGWSYQYWRARDKAAATATHRKITAESLPSVTQLFTERYMCDFLLAQTLGVWREHRGKANPYAGWPEHARDIRIFDPCCGAGHFLSAALEHLARLRAEDEGLPLGEAAAAVLRENLSGFELDPDCAQIAAITLKLAALRLAGTANFHVPDPIIDTVPDTQGPLADSLRRLGSLTPFSGQETGEEPGWQARLHRMLSARYTLVATNVPFLARAKQDPELQSFCAAHYPDAQRDLAAVFIERCLVFCAPGGTAALVTPQNWLFLKSYRALRQRLLADYTWNTLAWLGENAFCSQEAAGAFAVLAVITHAPPGPEQRLKTWNVAHGTDAEAKGHLLSNTAPEEVCQAEWRERGDGRIAGSAHTVETLSDYAEVYVGLQTGDNPRYIRYFWELPAIGAAWALQQSAPQETAPYCGREQVLRWESGAGALVRDPQARIQGLAALGRRGIAVRLMRNLCATLYEGEIGDQTAALVIPKHEADRDALWAYLQSPEFTRAVRALDAKINVAPATVGHAAFDARHWRTVAHRAAPPPAPASNDPTQWLFDGQIDGARYPLQAAVATMLGYRWPAAAATAPSQRGCEDGIALLPAFNGAPGAADRLRVFVGNREGDWLREAGYAGRSLEAWLRFAFFRQHCQVFKHRPFVWQVWDGLRDGFNALILYHRLDHAGLDRLIDRYLDPWIETQTGKKRTASEHLRARLEAIREGEAPHDLFVRWKTREQQPSGWNPDFDDGVRLNIRPWMLAGVLRCAPHIAWERDRGKNPPGTPWHAAFQGERINDFHLRLAEKSEAAFVYDEANARGQQPTER